MLKIRSILIITIAAAAVLLLAQACGGGGSDGARPTVTAIPLPAAEDRAGPGGPPQGFGRGLFAALAEPDEELAALFSISLPELEEELSVEGATLGRIAESVDLSREALHSFLLDRAEAALADAEGPGDQDLLVGQLPAIIDNIIDGEGFGVGNVPDGIPGRTRGVPGGFGSLLGLGGDNEELAALLELTAEELGELLADEELTLADVALDSGLGREELFGFLLAQAEESIEQAVDDGTVSRENADQFLDGLADTIDAFIDGRGFGGFGQGPFRGQATPGTP